MGHSQPLFLYFRPFNTVDSQQMFNKFCRWLDSNCGPLVSEATTALLFVFSEAVESNLTGDQSYSDTSPYGKCCIRN